MTTGPRGATGPAGPRGLIGQTGPRGFTGTSVTGPIGLRGPAGAVGSRGLTGATGEQGEQGERGDAGPAGGTITRIADTALSGHRVLRATSGTGVDYCDAMTSGHQNTLLGVSSGAAIGGGTIDVIALGEMEEGSWSWTAGLPIFVGANGALTQIYDPSWAWSRIIGVAQSATKIFISPRDPITL